MKKYGNLLRKNLIGAMAEVLPIEGIKRIARFAVEDATN